MQVKINRCKQCKKQVKEYYWDFCKDCAIKNGVLDEREINELHKGIL